MASQPQPPRSSLTVPRPFLVLSPNGRPTVLSALTTRPLSLVGSTQPLLVVPLLSPLRFAHQAPLLQQVLHLLQLLLVLLTPLLSAARPSLVLCTRLPSRVPRPCTPLCAQRRPQLHLVLLLPVQLQLHLLLLPLVQVQLHLLLLPLVQVQLQPQVTHPLLLARAPAQLHLWFQPLLLLLLLLHQLFPLTRVVLLPRSSTSPG